eukprot:GHUV01023633.1.p1 GENE.GHUV01023633.1~~GHUV01023633.1.p1  ORF type:complete len:157 (-),score=24.72 GHUV01023633.1:110-580(-)
MPSYDAATPAGDAMQGTVIYGAEGWYHSMYGGVTVSSGRLSGEYCENKRICTTRDGHNGLVCASLFLTAATMRYTQQWLLCCRCSSLSVPTCFTCRKMRASTIPTAAQELLIHGKLRVKSRFAPMLPAAGATPSRPGSGLLLPEYHMYQRCSLSPI